MTRWSNPNGAPSVAAPNARPAFTTSAKDEPVTCISCGNAWHARAGAEVEAAACRSKSPAPEKVKEADEDLAAEELVPDEDEEPSADDEVDLATGDDDLGVATGDEDEEG